MYRNLELASNTDDFVFIASCFEWLNFYRLLSRPYNVEAKSLYIYQFAILFQCQHFFHTNQPHRTQDNRIRRVALSPFRKNIYLCTYTAICEIDTHKHIDIHTFSLSYALFHTLTHKSSSSSLSLSHTRTQIFEARV